MLDCIWAPLTQPYDLEDVLKGREVYEIMPVS